MTETTLMKDMLFIDDFILIVVIQAAILVQYCMDVYMVFTK